MGTVAAPRLDERLRRFIAGSPRLATAAEVTRGVGYLAWDLGLPRPSYQAVRLTLIAARARLRAQTGSPTRGELALRFVDVLYQYPAPGQGGWYRRYVYGGGL